MAKDILNTRNDELELRRLEADLEIRRGELEEKRAQRESEERQHVKDAELKQLELTLATGRGLKFTSAQATVAAAALALVSGAMGGLFQVWATRDVEASKSTALVAIEQLKARANIDLEKQKQDAAERLDRAKFETSLITKAMEAPTRAEQVTNLKFYVEAGFLSDSGAKISVMMPEEYPSHTSATYALYAATDSTKILENYLLAEPEARAKLNALLKKMNVARSLTLVLFDGSPEGGRIRAELIALARQEGLIP